MIGLNHRVVERYIKCKTFFPLIFLSIYYTQHDRVRVIFQYALKILPKEECEVSVNYAYACSQRSCFAVELPFEN